MTRKLYTVSKWDKEAGKGYATDGTSWEGDPIEFLIRDYDLDSSYDGHLLPGETITAVEKHGMGLHMLFDIIVESGPRAFNQFSNASVNPPVPFDPNPQAEPLRGDDEQCEHPEIYHHITPDGCSCGWKPSDVSAGLPPAELSTKTDIPLPVTLQQYQNLLERVERLEHQIFGGDD